ncbi:transposase [Streptomyces sp. NBC_00623]|uniref:transposase n=1 Tax=Streptomyces sp. NBC_00623 TaxID=2975790 RepID=UPI00386E2CF4
MPCGRSVKFFCAAAAIDNRCSLNLVLASDTPERLVSEVSFAALCGTSPVEASPGETQRRRSNRGGDRQANAALYRIVLSRLRWDARSQDYLRRRLAEGKPRRQIIRCLKRYGVAGAGPPSPGSPVRARGGRGRAPAR